MPQHQETTHHPHLKHAELEIATWPTALRGRAEDLRLTVHSDVSHLKSPVSPLSTFHQQLDHSSRKLQLHYSRSWEEMGLHGANTHSHGRRLTDLWMAITRCCVPQGLWPESTETYPAPASLYSKSLLDGSACLWAWLYSLLLIFIKT